MMGILINCLHISVVLEILIYLIFPECRKDTMNGLVFEVICEKLTGEALTYKVRE